MKLSVNNAYHNDWVIFDGNYHQIHSTCPEYPFLKDARFGLGVVTWDNIQPIPLTPSILDKIKGVTIDTNNSIYMNFKFEFVYVTFQKSLSSIYFRWDNNGNSTKTLKYFHEYQQLIRLFTDKEIEIEW